MYDSTKTNRTWLRILFVTITVLEISSRARFGTAGALEMAAHASIPTSVTQQSNNAGILRIFAFLVVQAERKNVESQLQALHGRFNV